MIAGTSQTAADGRPLIEVESIDQLNGIVVLTGTAVAYEGTVLVDLLDVDGDVLDTAFATATSGGPGRGSWRVTMSLTDRTAALVIHEEEMEEGMLGAAHRRITLSL